MKIRNGFVSNSSASSFIVRHINMFGEKKGAKGDLNKSTIKKLLKYGFKETHLSHPTHLDNTDYKDESIWEPLKEDGEVLIQNYGYWVSCNEDEVIQWLVKNDIGFIANGHYGHVTYLFHKGDKHLMVFRNYGAEIQTYHYDKSWEEIVKGWNAYSVEPYRRIPIKEILEEK